MAASGGICVEAYLNIGDAFYTDYTGSVLEVAHECASGFVNIGYHIHRTWI